MSLVEKFSNKETIPRFYTYIRYADAATDKMTTVNKNTEKPLRDKFHSELITKALISKKETGTSGSRRFEKVKIKKLYNPEVLVESTRLNDIRYIDQHLISVNTNLNEGQYYLVRAQFLNQWKSRRTLRNIKGIGFFARATEFIFLRATPKIWGLKKIYFGITRGKNRILSKAEVLGRLVRNGFDICKIVEHEEISYVLCQKKKDPINSNPSYGPLFKMSRVGKGGKMIGVYKFRTMHPYSEFLQEYLIENHGYAETGKIKDDFRTTLWSRRLRKYWIDEIPQIINLLKGDMKLVGVRPVSEVYFNDIPKELQELRKKYKPGCIPPYVAFNKSGSLKSVLECEEVYLKMKEKDPYFTDTKLFFKAIFNIIFRGKRSA